METKNILPSKPWNLIRLAIKDLEKCEIDPNYKIDMDVWHLPPNEHISSDDGKCWVCLAGSVMAKHFKVPISEDVIIDFF